MDIDHDVIDAAAKLIAHSTDSLPIVEQVQHSGLNARDADILNDLLGELLPADLYQALRKAGERLREDDYSSDDKDAN
jgi:hypothetical protein